MCLVCDIVMLLWKYHSSNYMYLNVLLFQFFSLVIRGVPSLIFVQTHVLALLNSRPVIGYREGRAILI